MIPENFIILGAIIQLTGSLSYLVDTVKGKIQPNRVSWFLWALVPGIAFVAQIEQGVGLPALLAFMCGVYPVFIFLATFFNKKAVWKIGFFDYICGALAILALVLWYVTKIGNVAIFLSIVADFFALAPTILKAYRHPKTENHHEYLSSGIFAAITLLTLTTWNFEYYGFALYYLLSNVLIVYLVVVRPRFFQHQKYV